MLLKNSLINSLIIIIMFAMLSCNQHANSKESKLNIETQNVSILSTPSSPDLCTITGRITSQESNEKTFLLALASIIANEGTPLVASLDNHKAPRVLLDTEGKFVFTDVPVGQYALVIDKITESYLLLDPNTNSDFIINCEGGKIVDLGELNYNDLP